MQNHSYSLNKISTIRSKLNVKQFCYWILFVCSQNIAINMRYLVVVCREPWGPCFLLVDCWYDALLIDALWWIELTSPRFTVHDECSNLLRSIISLKITSTSCGQAPTSMKPKSIVVYRIPLTTLLHNIEHALPSHLEFITYLYIISVVVQNYLRPIGLLLILLTC